MNILKNKKIIIAAIIAILIIVLAAGGAVIMGGGSNSAQKQISLGEKYLSELDYDNAVISFTKAIDVDPMNEKAYIGLADAYIGMGDTEKAAEALQQGYDNTQSGEIKEKLDAVISQEQSGTGTAPEAPAEEEAPPEEVPKEVKWVLEPVFQCDDMLPIDDFAYDKNKGYEQLAFYKIGDSYGVIDETGKIILDHSKKARWCFACNLVDEGHTKYNPDGTQNGGGGHGGGDGGIVYDINKKQLVELSEYDRVYNPIGSINNKAYIVPTVSFSTEYEYSTLNGADNYFIGEVSPALYGNASFRYVSFGEYEANFGASFVKVRNPLETQSLYRKYRNVENFFSFAVNDIFAASEDGTAWYLYTANGAPLPFGPFEDAKAFHSGYAAVKQNGMWGYIDKEGKPLTPFVFENAASGYAGKAWAKQNGAWGVVQVTENTAPPQASASTAQTQKKINSVLIDADGGLRLRQAATVDSEMLTLIPKGTIIEVEEQAEGWLKVTYDGFSGWISEEFTLTVG